MYKSRRQKISFTIHDTVYTKFNLHFAGKRISISQNSDNRVHESGPSTRVALDPIASCAGRVSITRICIPASVSGRYNERRVN